MTYNEFRKSVLDTALALGCDAAETVFVEGDSFRVGILAQEIDSYSVSRQFGIGLRVQVDGRNGYAYTEKLDDPEALCRRALDNARVIGSTDDHPMQGPQTYVAVTAPENPVCEKSEREKIELAMEAERKALAADPRVERVAHNMLSTGHTTVHITNTLGLDARRSGSYSYSYIGPIVRDGEEVHDGMAFRTGSEMLDTGALAEEAVREGTAQFGASPVASGTYRVLFRNITADDFFEAFVPMFSADNAQKGLSPLAGHEGETIASAAVTLCDDPLHAVNPRAFDDEGTPSIAKTVVENGVFRTLLHNLKTAKKAGCASTSNADRPSAASPVGIAPSNFYLAPGTDDFEAMKKRLGNGLIITDVTGLHAGVNPVTGDFSLLSKGFLVENGEIVRPVEQITIAGSFLKLLKDVEAVGSDLKFTLPGSTMIGMPSILVSGLMVAGK